MVHAMHVLLHHGYTRLLIIVEKPDYVSRDQETFHLDTGFLSTCTGFCVSRVDTSLNGKGLRFAKMKRVFDDPSQPPQAFLCFGMTPSFLYGTDMARADSVLTVGNVDASILTQAVGRTLRPLIGRDSSRPIRMLKIYSGSSRMLRRPRPE